MLLNDSGAFDAVAKVELIDGEVVRMNAQYQRHAYLKSEIAFLVRNALTDLDGTWTTLVEVAVALPPSDMPEPDVVILRGAPGRGPVPVDRVALLIEVSDTTADTDLGEKAALYARFGVAEYWVLDDRAGRIVRFAQPSDAGLFREIVEVSIGEPLAAATISGLSINTASLD